MSTPDAFESSEEDRADRGGPGASSPFAGDERFRKEERLRRRPEFLRVQRGGARRSSRFFIVYARPNDRGWSRLGVTASRKTGKAHVRNWWKRRIREVFRRNKQKIPAGFDLVVIVKYSASRPDRFEVLRDDLLDAMCAAARRAGGRGEETS